MFASIKSASKLSKLYCNGIISGLLLSCEIIAWNKRFADQGCEFILCDSYNEIMLLGHYFNLIEIWCFKYLGCAVFYILYSGYSREHHDEILLMLHAQ